MKKQTAKELRIIAEKLEPTYEDCVISITGEDLVKLQQLSVDSNGKPIISHMSYKVHTQKLTNHYSKLKQAYLKGGVAECNKYIEQVNEQTIRSIQSTVEQHQSIEERKALFSI